METAAIASIDFHCAPKWLPCMAIAKLLLCCDIICKHSIGLECRGAEEAMHATERHSHAKDEHNHFRSVQTKLLFGPSNCQQYTLTQLFSDLTPNLTLALSSCTEWTEWVHIPYLVSLHTTSLLIATDSRCSLQKELVTQLHMLSALTIHYTTAHAQYSLYLVTVSCPSSQKVILACSMF